MDYNNHSISKKDNEMLVKATPFVEKEGAGDREIGR